MKYPEKLSEWMTVRRGKERATFRTPKSFKDCMVELARERGGTVSSILRDLVEAARLMELVYGPGAWESFVHHHLNNPSDSVWDERGTTIH